MVDERPSSPLRNRFFRASWFGSIASNIGIQVLAVSAAWTMTELTGSPGQVAVVQTALLLPMLLFGLIAGPVVDIWSKRGVALVALGGMVVLSSGLIVIERGDHLTPPVLLAAVFCVGTAYAFFAPAWQMAVRERVSSRELPAAISLNSISFNLGRSAGPALGGALVAVSGAAAGFFVTALSALPILFVFARSKSPSRSPDAYRERLLDAVGGGLRYVRLSRLILEATARGVMMAACGCVLVALAPLVASEVLGLGAGAYGALLGSFGLGSVAGATLVGELRRRLEPETVLRLLAVVGMLGCATVALSRSQAVAMLGFFVTGLSYMAAVTFLNVLTQIACPDWISARILTTFQSSVAGGVALASATWGGVASLTGTPTAIAIAGGAYGLSLLVGLRRPLQSEAASLDDGPVPLRWREDQLPPEVGPIVIEIGYLIDEADEAEFRDAMLQLGVRMRRIGFRDSSLVKNALEPGRWTLRYGTRTWGEYLAVRQRLSAEDRVIVERIRGLQSSREPTVAALQLVVST